MLKYIGKGALPGIPARDLSDEEVKRYGTIEVFGALGVTPEEFKKHSSPEEALLSTGLYERASKPKPSENKLRISKSEDKEGE